MYCIAIKSSLNGKRCPLAKGKCMWQHAQTNDCKYTPQELDSTAFATRVGRTPPTEVELETFKNNLRKSL